jgi:hypothetical protein
MNRRRTVLGWGRGEDSQRLQFGASGSKQIQNSIDDIAGGRFVPAGFVHASQKAHCAARVIGCVTIQRDMSLSSVAEEEEKRGGGGKRNFKERLSGVVEKRREKLGSATCEVQAFHTSAYSSLRSWRCTEAYPHLVVVCLPVPASPHRLDGWGSISSPPPQTAC